MGNITTLTIQKSDGVTQALLKKVQEEVKAGNATLTDGEITPSEFKATLDVLDEINEARKKNGGETIFKGATQRNGLKSDWHKNYVVNPGQTIEFTEAEMNKLYEAMGVQFKSKQQLPETPSDSTVTKPIVPGEKPEEVAEDKNNKKKNTWKWILAGVGTALAVGAAIFLAKGGRGKALTSKLTNLFKGKKTKPAPQPAPQPAPKPAPQPAPKPAPQPAPKPVSRKQQEIDEAWRQHDNMGGTQAKPANHKQNLANGYDRRTTANGVKNINTSNTNAQTRKQVQEAFEGEPIPAETAKQARDIAYVAPTAEEKQALDALNKANAEERARLNSIANNHTGATTEEIYKTITGEAKFKPGLHEYTRNGNYYVIDVDKNGKVRGILRETSKDGMNAKAKAEYLSEEKIAKFLSKNPEALPIM